MVIKYLFSIKLNWHKRLILIAIAICILIFVYIIPIINFFNHWNDVPIPLVPFVSQDKSYSINLPDGWGIYETNNGSRGDPYVVVQSIRKGIPYPVIAIIRNKFSTNNLDEVLFWGKQYAYRSGGGETPSPINNYDTARYKGGLLEYTVHQTGLFFNHYGAICREWLSIDQQMGYGIIMCATKDQWPNINDRYQEMLSSLLINR
jgi:hypothetical protein